MIKSHRDRRLLQCTAHADTVHEYLKGVQFTDHYVFSLRSDLSETNQGECVETNRLFNAACGFISRIKFQLRESKQFRATAVTRDR